MPATTYQENETPRQAKFLCELGATDAELAEFFRVSRSTISLWKIEHQEFSEALALGKEPADNRVKMSLYHRACGYSHEEDDIRTCDNKVVVTPTIKHYPPDTTACIFWLKNRLPLEFRAAPEPGDDDYVAPVSIVVNVVDASADVKIDKPNA
jgi:hypothetical protein